MKKFQFFVTGKFDAAELQDMREKAEKPRALFDIGQELRQRRKQSNLARPQVADRCGVSADRLGRFEHGAADIGFAALDKYCFVVGLDIRVLLAPYLGADADAANTVVELARNWTGQGKSLAIEDVIDSAASGKSD